MPVLWAEDAVEDRVLIRSAAETARRPPRIRFVRDGDEAVEEAQRTTPRLIVLDVNMPRLSGVEALRHIRSKPGLHQVPVVMFSTAQNDDEVARCRDLGATAYVQKPLRFEDFVRAVRGILDLAA